MADIVATPQAAVIDHVLDYSLRTWCSIPELAEEWDDWDEFSRLTYVVDWPVHAERLADLRRWHAQELMSPGQAERFAELERLVAQHEPTLKRLFGE
jgi:hypothetical protein